MDESLKLYVEVRKISSKDVSLVIVRDNAQNSLNLAVSIKNDMSHAPIFKTLLCFKKHYVTFYVKFVINDQVGSRII